MHGELAQNSQTVQVGEFMNFSTSYRDSISRCCQLGKVHIISPYNRGVDDLSRWLAFQVGERGEVCGHHFQEEGMRSCSETRLAEPGSGDVST